MIQKVKAPLTVVTTFNHQKRCVTPNIIKWDGKIYKIKKIGLHHWYKKGRTLYHVFSISDNNTFFKIVLNTDTLHWELEEISDGLTD